MKGRCMENVGWESIPLRCNQPAVQGEKWNARCAEHSPNRWAAFTDDELGQLWLACKRCDMPLFSDVDAECRRRNVTITVEVPVSGY